MWGKKDKRLRSTDCMVNMHVKYGVSLQVNGVGSGELAPLRLYILITAHISKFPVPAQICIHGSVSHFPVAYWLGLIMPHGQLQTFCLNSWYYHLPKHFYFL